MKRIYLDYNATTPIDPGVLEVMMPYLKEDFGNPSSIHSYGRKGKAALDTAREQVAELLGASPREILFTSGGSESNNHAIVGAAGALRERGNHLITTEVEHESVLETFKFLENAGFRVTYLGVDSDGLADLDELRDSITDETVLVSCMYANNETGTIMPIAEIASVVKEKGVILHSDAVQAAGKLEIDTGKIPIDLLTVSAHKFYGPKGTGALFIGDELLSKRLLPPLIHGGGQERGMRSGTENVAGIAGMGEAASIAKSEMSGDRERVQSLRDKLYEKISGSVFGVGINGSIEKTLWNTINLRIKDVDGVSLSMNLDLEGVAVSTGSACSQGNVDPSHVLKAMGLSRDEASSSVRISLGRFTTAEDIEFVSDLIPKVVKRIRSVGLTA
jgi:cysteine desulfurase